jgi:hypothetical protein
LQCFFVVENLTANAVSVAIWDNGNRLDQDPELRVLVRLG